MEHYKSLATYQDLIKILKYFKSLGFDIHFIYIKKFKTLKYLESRGIDIYSIINIEIMKYLESRGIDIYSINIIELMKYLENGDLESGIDIKCINILSNK